MGNAAEIDPVRNIAITGNTFSNVARNFTTNYAIYLVVHADIQDLLISSNQFSDVGITDNALNANIHLLVGSTAGTAGASNITVTDNQFDVVASDRNFGNAILFGGNPLATTRKIESLDISRNRIHKQQNTAILVELNDFTVSKAVRIDDNSIQDVAGTAADSAIHLILPSATEATSTSISRNLMENVGGVGFPAMVVTSANSVRHLRVDSNILTTCVGDGFDISVGGLGHDVSISDNSIHDSGLSGISANLTGLLAGVTGFRNLSICQNRVTDTDAHAIDITAVSATSNPNFTDVQVAGNSLRKITGSGINFVSTVTGVLTNQILNGQINNNVIRNTTTDGIGLNITDGAVSGLSVSGNIIEDVSAGEGILLEITSLSAADGFTNLSVVGNQVMGVFLNGISIKTATGDITGMSVNGNTVTDWSLSAAATYYGGILIYTSGAVTAASTSNNTLKATNTYSLGLYFRVYATIDTWTVNGNALDAYKNPDLTNTESMRWDSGASADQYGMVFTGNVFREFVTAINVAGSSFSPNQSVVVGNAERRVAVAAGGWTAFAVLFNTSAKDLNQD